MLKKVFIPIILGCLVALPHCSSGMKEVEPIIKDKDPAALNGSAVENRENTNDKPELTANINEENSLNQAKPEITAQINNQLNPQQAVTNAQNQNESWHVPAQGTAQYTQNTNPEGSWNVPATATNNNSTTTTTSTSTGTTTSTTSGNDSGSTVANPPVNSANNPGTTDSSGSVKSSVTGIYNSSSGTLLSSKFFQSSSTILDDKAVTLDKAYVTINPGFIGNDFSRDLAALPKPKLTVDEYCRGPYDECMKTASGPAGTGVCSNAYSFCTDLNNCDTRKAVCFKNAENDPKLDCFNDFDVCRLEAICRNRKTACVTDTQEPTQCEGDRQACNAKIPGHLSDCVTQKQNCLAGGDVSPCYQDYESCKASGI